ncbi:hypothetical protein MmTuc01_0020 [Methanosarcina mazei Tuc01]|uniref:Uncharacterized protein n=1 Tax=Methanosarcina mazei Tuc01 TaxID=1236903 RepID=M1PZQ6_METMZ|nr:hypothetical protein MmTuc01_0020 [Methanosarcina mazei Tuc01]
MAVFKSKITDHMTYWLCEVILLKLQKVTGKKYISYPG